MNKTKLTTKQWNILAMKALGMTNYEVARQLDVTEGYIKKCCVVIVNSLRAQSMTNAVYLACKGGII